MRPDLSDGGRGSRNQRKSQGGRYIKICKILKGRRKGSTLGGSNEVCENIRREGNGRTETRRRRALLW